MLTLYDFSTLTETQKAEAVWQGSFLADREENGLMGQLYALSSFMWNSFMTQPPIRSYHSVPLRRNIY
jgi:hypothetical protein